jgi:hypothetical protein
MPRLNTQTSIRITCSKGSRTLVLDAEDVREIVNTLIRQNMIQFSVENMPDYRKEESNSPYAKVPYENALCHAAYAMVETTDGGAEVISVCVDMGEGFLESSHHETDATVEEVYGDLIDTPYMNGLPTQTSRPQWITQSPDVRNTPRVEGNVDGE